MSYFKNKSQSSKIKEKGLPQEAATVREYLEEVIATFLLKTVFSQWNRIYRFIRDCLLWEGGVIYAFCYWAVCSNFEVNAIVVWLFPDCCAWVSVCVRACVLEASEGVLMPAANWHTQQMGQRLIPCLLTVHSNVDVCVCVHVCETSHHKPSPVV